MKKFLIICFATLFCCASYGADDDALCLTIATTDGDETYFGLYQQPVITYGDKTITIVSATYTIEAMSLSDIEMYYFSYALPTGIGKIAVMDGGSLEFSNGKALVTGLKAGAQVCVYTADGQIVGSVAASQDGNVCVDLNNLKSGGVYILRTPTASYKIVK